MKETETRVNQKELQTNDGTKDRLNDKFTHLN